MPFTSPKRITIAGAILDISIDIFLMVAAVMLYYHFFVHPILGFSLDPHVMQLVNELKLAVYLMFAVPFVVGFGSLVYLMARIVKGTTTQPGAKK